MHALVRKRQCFRTLLTVCEHYNSMCSRYRLTTIVITIDSYSQTKRAGIKVLRHVLHTALILLFRNMACIEGYVLCEYQLSYVSF